MATRTPQPQFHTRLASHRHRSKKTRANHTMRNTVISAAVLLLCLGAWLVVSQGSRGSATAAPDGATQNNHHGERMHKLMFLPSGEDKHDAIEDFATKAN